MSDGNQNIIVKRLRSLVSTLRLTGCKSTHQPQSTVASIIPPNDQCHICSVPLSSLDHRHVHRCGSSQCGNRWHLTCPYCCTRLYKEKQFECNNNSFARIKHGKKADHRIRFAHTVCFCPACTFANYSNNLYDHVWSNEREIRPFVYGESFFAPMEKDEKHVILREEDEGVIFTLNYGVLQEAGRVLSVGCIGPPTLNKIFKYKLTVICGESCFEMNSTPEVYARLEEHTSAKDCLIIPSNINPLFIEVFIEKVELDDNVPIIED